MDTFNGVMKLVQGGLAAYGAWLVITGAVTFASGFSNHQSTEMRDGGAKIFGGVVVISASVFAGNITIG